MQTSDPMVADQVKKIVDAVIIKGLAIREFDKQYAGVSYLQMEMSAHRKRDQLRSDLEKALAELKNNPERELGIPLLMDDFYRRGDVNQTIEALHAIGTIAVVEKFLDIFRKSKPSSFHDDGARDARGEDGPAASAILEIPGGTEELKRISNREEMEQIALTTGAHCNLANPGLIELLGHVGTHKAIGRLIVALLQPDWSEELRRLARDALARTGRNAQAQLLKALTESNDRQNQAGFRQRILEVLEQSGDEESLAIITPIAKSDAQVAESARTAMQAISKRVHK